MSRKTVKITNGEMEAMVAPRAAKVYERHGWTVVDDGSSESEAPVAPAASPEAPPVQEPTSRKAE